MRYLELSHEIFHGMLTYPGLPTPQIGTHLARAESRSLYEGGAEFHIGTISLCTNTGTYLDTPAHRFADGHDLAGLALSACMNLPALVIDLPDGAAEPELLDGLDLTGRAVLFRTNKSACFGTPAYLEPGHPYLSEACCERLVAEGAQLVGIDALNVDDTSQKSRPAHTVLLAAGIPIVEHLTNLAELPASGALFTALPLRIQGLGTFPVRAIASIPDRDPICELVIDCIEVKPLAHFWAAVFNTQAVVESLDWAECSTQLHGGLKLAFQRVPEAKIAKNRLHLDLWSDDLESDTQRLEGLGATRIGPVIDGSISPFQVLADPAGNEFCLVT